MATWYVNSAATGTGAGTSWANACTTMAALLGLATPPAAGDSIDVASTHAESTGAAVTWTFAGTIGAPIYVYSCDTSNAPAQASDLIAGATFAVSGSNTFMINGSVYFWGCNFSLTGATTLNNGSVNAAQVYEGCSFKFNNTSTFTISIGGSNAAIGQSFTWNNTTVTFGAASQSLSPRGSTFRWRNTASALAGATFPTSLITSSSSTVIVIELDGVDLSALGSGKTLVAAQARDTYGTVTNCKLGSGVTVAAAPTSARAVIDVVNADSGADGYRNERYGYAGTLTTSTTTNLQGGASDGVQAVSWQVATSANSQRVLPFECFPIAQWWGSGLGASHSLTLQVLGPAGLTNADVWVDVEYLGDATAPRALLATSAPATLLTAGTALSTTGAGTWNTPGGNTAYTISVPFTPQLAGYVRAAVKVAKPSTTLYVDGYPQIV